MDDIDQLHYTDDCALVHAAEQTAIAKRRKKPVDSDLVGLALSGGGIRSASFCLGVLQALDSKVQAIDSEKKCLDRIDYLSTVSGGGYIGCCLTACMHQLKGKVPFNENKGYGDTPSIRHIRDYSNYLIPRGFGDVVTAAGLLGRGLVANAALVAPLFVLSVMLLLFARPDKASLPHYGFLQPLVDRLDDFRLPFIPGFPLTSCLLALLVPLLLCWALYKALKASAAQDPELQGGFVRVWKGALFLVALVGWLELQPIVLKAIVDAGSVFCKCSPTGDIKGCIQALLGKWFTVATPWLAPVAAIVSFLSRQLGMLVSPRKGLRASSVSKRIMARTLLLGTAIVLPSLLWLAYLKATIAFMPATGATFVKLFFLLATLVALFLAVNPNATSLHRLYRDRLSKAFLFDPAPNDSKNDRRPVSLRLHEIDPSFCPFPIINAALNIGGSAFANKRGRNADFFEFTPKYAGSEATGWIATSEIEQLEPKLDLGTAMAISGAAVSPNMGSATIKPLVPTLALLNVRLGFWLANPKHLKSILRRLIPTGLYLYREIVSNLTPESYTIYVTDGGNIENLGVHALLRRRCKLIIAVDAEADPALTFGAFLKLQRYARIDFGALIDLPWQPIQTQNKAVDEAVANHEPMPSPGPHIAIGRIRYDPVTEGVLVYVKSSLTGDEADYILDYKSRNPTFPHETTGDQFFGEEQLEVYRALGFHVMRLFLDDEVPVVAHQNPGESQDQARNRMKSDVRHMLGL